MAVIQLNPPARRASASPYVIRAVGEYAVASLAPDLPVCARCGGSGRIVAIKGDVRAVGRCRCQLEPDRVSLFNHAELPARHAQSTLGSFSLGMEGAAKAMATVAAWMDRLSRAMAARETMPGLVLHGAVGRGKTHLLVGIVRWLILEHGVEVRFVEFSRLLAQLREGFDKGQSDRTMLNDLVSVPILAIDELGKGRLTDWELSVVDELISRRYDALGCTLGTTNYPPAIATGRGAANLAEGARMQQSLGDRVGERVYSRLREMCELVEVSGLDFRALRG